MFIFHLSHSLKMQKRKKKKNEARTKEFAIRQFLINFLGNFAFNSGKHAMFLVVS